MYKLIDTHAHLDSAQFDLDRKDVINNSKIAGVKYVINPATNYESCLKTIQLANEFEFLYICIGVHPHDAKEVDDNLMVKIEELLEHKKVVGIGEIGLDYHYNYSPKEKQKEVFRDFIRLAKRRKLPIVIHSRESDRDIIDILESEMNEDLLGQFHCFSSESDLADRILGYGFFISFTGSITFNKNKSDNILEKIPLERLLLETDSPYMSPVPYRGKRNEPCRLTSILPKIASVKGFEESAIAEATYDNAVRFFKLPKT